VRLLAIIFIFIGIFTHSINAQVIDSTSISRDSLNKNRLIMVASIESGVCAGTLIGLNQLWYANYARSKFHTFNDNDEWMQMDKCGHFFVSYKVGRYGFQILEWTGLQKNKALIYGGTLGFVFLTGVEFLDAYSTEWGFSPGDMIANSTGAAFFIGQQLLWNEQKLNLKVSFHHSPYAKYRPNVLGSNFPERILKDYNGQTYWLSVALGQIFKRDKFPGWISLAVGYGADGMIGGSANPILNNEGIPYPVFERYRQYYLSLDIDLSKIRTKNKTLKFLLNTFAFIKFPLPALEYNRIDKFKFHPIYF